ncbi:MAG TPA: PEP-CTERM sorting domain-containing protein [Burkholderiales bacterium]|nr:PEP-CTERM sorting domain-containing protein [Burkholderiales bacterium]
MASFAKLVLVVAAALLGTAPASAQVIFTEDFSAVTADPFLDLGAGNTSERWASTLYAEDPVDGDSQWQFFENSYLAFNNDGSGNKAILLNEAAGSVNAGVAMKTPGLSVIAGQTYSLSFDHWGDNVPGTYSFTVEVDTILLPIVTRFFAAAGTGSFLRETFNFIAPDNEVVITFTDQTLSGFTSGIIDNIAVALIPEPGTYALLLAGLGLLGFVATRRRGSLRAA